MSVQDTAIRHKTELNVWDTQHFPERQSFAAFRDGLCGTFMPWSIENQGDTVFHARLEGLNLPAGSIGRVRMTPVIAERTKDNLAHSDEDCIYGNFVLAGELQVEQRGRVSVVKQGDVVLYDSSEPVILREQHTSQYEDVPFMIRKERFASMKNPSATFSNVLLSQSTLIRPLSTCLTHIANNLQTMTQDEVTALFDACISLLPVAVGHAGHDRSANSDLPNANYALREILDYIRWHISDDNLTPQSAAAAFNVSVRYVHKLFAANGTTFNSYVASKRLDHVRTDLLSQTSMKQPISGVAYRWGFNDLSTFNRLFKARFGITPTRFRTTQPRP